MFVFVYLIILSVLKVKNYLKTNLKINILIIKNYLSNYKMVIESLKIGTKSNYNCDDIVYVYVYDIDVKLIKVQELVLIFILSGTCLILTMKLII